MSVGKLSALAALVMAVVVSAVGVVYVQYEVRVLFAKKQSLLARRDALNVEWGKLQLEQSTWGTQSRVEHVARQKLEMINPSPDSVVFVRQ